MFGITAKLNSPKCEEVEILRKEGVLLHCSNGQLYEPKYFPDAAINQRWLIIKETAIDCPVDDIRATWLLSEN